MSISIRRDPNGGYFIRVRAGVPPTWHPDRESAARFVERMWEYARP